MKTIHGVSKNRATTLHGVFEKKVNGVVLSEVATSEKQAKRLALSGWIKKDGF